MEDICRLRAVSRARILTKQEEKGSNGLKGIGYKTEKLAVCGLSLLPGCSLTPPGIIPTRKDAHRVHKGTSCPESLQT